MTRTDLMSKDSIGLPKFDEQRAQAMVNMVRDKNLLKSDPPPSNGRGIVISGGGIYLPHAWVAARVLRDKGCKLPIQVWHFGEREMPRWAIPHFSKLGVETVDIYTVMRANPIRQMSPWLSKNYAIRHCPWKEVLFCDADSFASDDPEKLMDLVQGKSLFFSDVANHARNGRAWSYCGVPRPTKEGEGGQYIVNKETGWMGLRWALWLGEHTDVFFKLVHGDKDITPIGFKVAQSPIIVSEECEWRGWGISQSWEGKEWFRHSMGAKRGEHPWPDNFITNAFEEWASIAHSA